MQRCFQPLWQAHGRFVTINVQTDTSNSLFMICQDGSNSHTTEQKQGFIHLFVRSKPLQRLHSKLLW